MRTFTNQEVMDIWREDFDHERAEVIESEESGGGRWTNTMTIVFRLDDKHYRASFWIDACEASEGNGTFDHCRLDDEFDDIVEVELREVLVKKWMPV